MNLSITKEDVDKLPLEKCSIEVVVVENRLVAESAIEQLKQTQQIGFDTETRPSFKVGCENQNKVALLQLSTETKCFLFRLNKIGFYKPLFDLLEEGTIIKIGFSVSNDLSSLRKNVNFEPNGFVDLQHEARILGFESLSLQKIYALLFKKKISKRQRLSNWEATKLTDAQENYAALDAWCCLRIYKKFRFLHK